ncbi:hypothetical protein HY78_30645 (plasmid) [Rhizorhabdus wittichii DC-6]|nr:hypothetical protein HY78_30645 [Rhizorhabdus wittichii DC-6]
MWRDALERSGRDAAALDRAFDGSDKYVVPTHGTQTGTMQPLRAIYALASEVDDVAIRPQTGQFAIRTLVTNTYRARYIALVGDPRAHFAACLDLVRAVPVYELARPWDPARIMETVDRIEAHLTV